LESWHALLPFSWFCQRGRDLTLSLHLKRAHDTLHDEKGNLLMRQHTRFVLLGSILLAASLFFAVTPHFSPAFAATTSPASTPANAPQLTQLVQVSVITSSATSRVSAGDPCRTSSRQQNAKDFFGITLFWFKMQTRYCWDNRTVTYHRTTISWGVTGPGAAVGWAYISNSGIRFNCYVASGSTRQCSGNHEWATASFHNVVTRQVCLPHIDEWENYRGQFFSGGRSC
jgi:hypothetical protein